MAVLRRYYHMSRAEIAGMTVPEARALMRRLPTLLQREAQLIGYAAMGGKFQ